MKEIESPAERKSEISNLVNHTYIPTRLFPSQKNTTLHILYRPIHKSLTNHSSYTNSDSISMSVVEQSTPLTGTSIASQGNSNV